MKLLKSWTALAGATALTGCAVGPNYHPPTAVTPSAYVAEAVAGSPRASGPTGVDLRQWWRSLHDRELDSLVDRAIQSNLDLEIALTRIQEARVRIIGTSAEALPQIDAVAGGGGGTGSDNTNGRVPSEFRAAENPKGLSNTVAAEGLNGFWDLDLFGRVKREVEAEVADAEALQEAREWIAMTVAADVARAYLDMRAQQRQLVVLGENIDAARTAQKLAQSRLDQGLTNELDVNLAQRQTATLEADRGPLVAQIEASRHAIAVLLGQFPESLAKELARPGTIPASPPRIPVGVPVDLLRRRPDIQEIERQLAAANARVGSAIAELFPDVVLTGAAGGQQGPRASAAITPAAAIWSLGPSVTMPFLDFGALDAQIEIADLRTHEILIAYRQAILKAVQQVDDAAVAYHQQQLRLADLDRALTAAREATRIATERYDRGLTDFLNVLDAERQQFDLEELHVAARQAEAEALIALFKAIGGGWPLDYTIPEVRHPDPAAIAVIKYLTKPGQDR
jgi:NodT family efflux transporter outer membrane factor (OMF) lipoprotein